MGFNLFWHVVLLKYSGSYKVLIVCLFIGAIWANKYLVNILTTNQYSLVPLKWKAAKWKSSHCRDIQKSKTSKTQNITHVGLIHVTIRIALMLQYNAVGLHCVKMCELHIWIDWKVDDVANYNRTIHCYNLFAAVILHATEHSVESSVYESIL